MIRRKIMIINWRWTWLKKHRVNDFYLSQPKNQYLLKEVSKGEGKFFECYPVQKSDKTEEAIVVVTSIYQGKNTKVVLENLINHIQEKFCDQPTEIYLFLHRGNFYSSSDVLQILEKIDYIDKCFLFAAGRDYLYFNQKTKAGLLDAAGGFRRGEINGEKIVTAKKIHLEGDTIKITREIQQPYFDQVWDYYKFEFYEKINTLKEDFLRQLLWINVSDYPISKTAILEVLQEPEKDSEEPKLLVLERLKSFVGQYNNLTSKIQEQPEKFEELMLLKEERSKIETLEKKHRVSYILDDCNANLEHVKPNDKDDQKAQDLYFELVQMLERTIFHKEEIAISHQDILNIRRKFDELTNILPGSINKVRNEENKNNLLSPRNVSEDDEGTTKYDRR